MGGVHPLVTEGAADFKDGPHAGHSQALEEQLRGDTQINISGVGVHAGDERAGVSPTMHRLQDWGFYLHIALLTQGVADGSNNG